MPDNRYQNNGAPYLQNIFNQPPPPPYQPPQPQTQIYNQPVYQEFDDKNPPRPVLPNSVY
jgi:hypothetical protein